MNTPNPLVPQGTFLEKGKAQIRITVFAILAIHVMLLGVLLIAGCNKKTQTDQAQDTGLPPVPPPPPVDTNWPGSPGGVPPVSATQDVVHPPTPVIPEITPPPPIQPEPTAAGFTEHTISKGESFYTLGKKYGVGFKAIADANSGVNPNRLKIGDKVKIPPSKSQAGGASAAAVTTTAVDGGTKTYKVKSGDNLMKIAKANGVSLKELRAANNLKTDQIKVGQSLKIPSKATAAAPPPVESIPPVPPAAAPPAPTGLVPPPR